MPSGLDDSVLARFLSAMISCPPVAWFERAFPSINTFLLMSLMPRKSEEEESMMKAVAAASKAQSFRIFAFKGISLTGQKLLVDEKSLVVGSEAGREGGCQHKEGSNKVGSFPADPFSKNFHIWLFVQDASFVQV